MKSKKDENRFFIKDKKGIQLAVSTIILLVLGVLVLIGLILILTMGWDNFKMYLGAILGSEVQQARKMCNLQCKLGYEYDYCCEEKNIKAHVYNCQDEILKGDCSLDCTGLC